MSIFKTLKFDNIEIGNVQSVDEMTIVPILGAERGSIAKPSSLSFQRTTSYGTMVFENDDPDREAIIPANMMVRGSGGQDHAMSGSGTVPKKQVRSFEDACCIEETQEGYLESHGNEQDILPVDLRKALLKPTIRTLNSYSKLWGKIKTWLQGVKTSRGGSAHLRHFYDTPDIKRALEEFAAEFEPVDNQIGAIVMFSGIPVGIEIMPSTEHWEEYWQYLIRGCYGAEMIRRKQRGELEASTLIMPVLPDLSSDANQDQIIQHAEEVKQILEGFSENLRQAVLPLLETIEVKTHQIMDQSDELVTGMITTNTGGGDIIEQDNNPVYLSLVL